METRSTRPVAYVPPTYMQSEYMQRELVNGLETEDEESFPFYEPISDQYILVPKLRVLGAQLKVNRAIAENGSCSVNDYLGWLGAPKQSWLNTWGWEVNNMWEDNIFWIDFWNEPICGLGADTDYYYIHYTWMPYKGAIEE